MNSVANVPYTHSPPGGASVPGSVRGNLPAAAGNVRAPRGADVQPSERTGSEPRWRRLSAARADSAHALFSYGRAAAVTDAPARGVHIDTFA